MNRILLLFIFAFLQFTTNTAISQIKPVKVKNVILLIGDGMGVAQIYAGYTANKGKLNLEKAQFIGFSKTSSANNYITDSGAGATAISTGCKTHNGYLGLDSLGIKRETILETAAKNGRSTGIVVTCEVVHATPAAFMVHADSRYNYEKIALEMSESPINLLIGGGRKYFENRTDSFNLSEKIRNKHTEVIYSLEEARLSAAKNLVCLASNEHLPKITEGRGDFLIEGVQIALNKLSQNEKGFFLMVEGSQIDWGAHANNTDYVVTEMIDFDKAIGEAFRFADQNPGTLVIITADHETGGMALTGGNYSEGTVKAEFNTINHTAVMAPVFAYGVGAELFAGMYENTAIYTKIMQLFSFNATEK